MEIKTFSVILKICAAARDSQSRVRVPDRLDKGLGKRGTVIIIPATCLSGAVTPTMVSACRKKAAINSPPAKVSPSAEKELPSAHRSYSLSIRTPFFCSAKYSASRP